MYTNLSAGSVVLASNLSNNLITGLLTPTTLTNNAGLLYICQRNNPTKVYNSSYSFIGNITITGFPNLAPTTNNADYIAFIPNTNLRTIFS